MSDNIASSISIAPINAISPLHGIIELTPMLFLLAVSVLDIRYNFLLRAQFCAIVNKIYSKMDSVRGRQTPWECPQLKKKIDGCPIFYSLKRHRPELEEDCSTVFHNVEPEHTQKREKDEFWVMIRKGFILQHQATFYEVIILQFFLISLLRSSNNMTICGISLIFTAVLFIFPYVGDTYVNKSPQFIFQDGNIHIKKFEVDFGLIRVAILILFLAIGWVFLTTP